MTPFKTTVVDKRVVPLPSRSAKFHEYFIRRRNFRLGVPGQISVDRAKRTVAKYTHETERGTRSGGEDLEKLRGISDEKTHYARP